MNESSLERINAAAEQNFQQSYASEYDENPVNSTNPKFNAYRPLFLRGLLDVIGFKFEITEEIVENLKNEDYEIPLPDVWMLYKFVPNHLNLETKTRSIKYMAYSLQSSQIQKRVPLSRSLPGLIQLYEDWFDLSEKLKKKCVGSKNYPFREACGFLDLCILKPLAYIRLKLHDLSPKLHSLADKYFDVVVNTPVCSTLLETYFDDVFQVMNTNIDYYANKKEAILFCDKALKGVLVTFPHRIWVIEFFSNVLTRYGYPAECGTSTHEFVKLLTQDTMMRIYYLRLKNGRPVATIRALLGLLKALFSVVLDVSTFNEPELIHIIGQMIFNKDSGISSKAAEAYVTHLNRIYQTERILEEIIIHYGNNKADSDDLPRYVTHMAKAFPYFLTNDASKQLLEIIVDGENTPLCFVHLSANAFACINDAIMYSNHEQYSIKLVYLLETLPGYLKRTYWVEARDLLIRPLATANYEALKQNMDKKRFEELMRGMYNYLEKEFIDCGEVDCSYVENLVQCISEITVVIEDNNLFNELFDKLYKSYCSEVMAIDYYQCEIQDIPLAAIWNFRTILQKMFVLLKSEKEILDTKIFNLAFVKIFHELKRLIVDTGIMIKLAGKSNTFIDCYAIGVMCLVVSKYRFYVPNFYEQDHNLLVAIPSVVAYLMDCLDNKEVLAKCAVIRVRTIFESATLLLKNFDITLDDFIYDTLVGTLVLLVFETKIFNVEDGDEDNEKQPERIKRNLSYMLEAFSSLHYSEIQVPNDAATRLLLYYPFLIQKHGFQTELLNLMKAIYYYDYDYFQFIMSRTLFELYVAKKKEVGSSGIKEAFKEYISCIQQCQISYYINLPFSMMSAIATGVIELIILKFREFSKSKNRLSILLYLCPFYKNIPTKYQKAHLISLTYYLVKLLNFKLTALEHKTLKKFITHLRYLPWYTMAFYSPTDDEMIEAVFPESLEEVLQYMKDNQDKVQKVMLMALK